jgi:hypothetical protein
VFSVGPTQGYIKIYILTSCVSPQTCGVQLALFADDTSLYASDRKEGFVVRKLQRGLSSMETWCERWNIKINEEKTQGIVDCLTLTSH